MKKLGTFGKSLETAPAHERAGMKGKEIAKKLKPAPRKKLGKFDVEVVKVEEVPNGVAIFARVWENNEQVGFGPDGSIDIERFVFINPPVLVPSGEKEEEVLTRTDGQLETTQQDVLAEDPEAAILAALEHTISVVPRHDSTKIKNGKVGRTTTTVYPDAAPASTSCDAYLASGDGGGSTWAQVRDTGVTLSTTDNVTLQNVAHGSGYYQILRTYLTFDTSSIPDGDTITAATISLAGRGNATSNGDTSSAQITASNPASNTTIATSDWTNISNTSFSSMALSSWVNTDGVYNDFALDANGIANITKTGVSKFAWRNSRDVSNSAPTGSNALYAHSADVSGTSKDPKLVITHSAAGPANVKTVNGIAIASVKTLNGIAIGSVKTVNGIA